MANLLNFNCVEHSFFMNPIYYGETLYYHIFTIFFIIFALKMIKNYIGRIWFKCIVKHVKLNGDSHKLHKSHKTISYRLKNGFLKNLYIRPISASAPSSKHAMFELVKWFHFNSFVLKIVGRWVGQLCVVFFVINVFFIQGKIFLLM